MTENKLLFYGPKGCGKTLFASAIFGEMQKANPMTFTVKVKKSNILEDPKRNIAEVFDKIDQFKINEILIEDFDSLMNDLDQYKAAKHALVENIKQLNSQHLLVVTARYPETIERNILSDFDALLPLYYPNKKDRLDILRVHTNVKRKVSFANDVNISMIAEKTAWFSGHDIEKLILYAIKLKNKLAIDHDTINMALKHIKNSIIVEKRINEMKKLVKFTVDHCEVKTVRDELIAYFNTIDLYKSETEKKKTKLDWNKVIDLKPNISGFGININELISHYKSKQEE